jgi:hypothetical protein
VRQQNQPETCNEAGIKAHGIERAEFSLVQQGDMNDRIMLLLLEVGTMIQLDTICLGTGKESIHLRNNP